MDKNSIKSLLTQTFVNEAKVPGLDTANKAKEKSGKQNKEAIKDMEKELSDYDKDSKKETKDSKDPVKFNYTNDSEAEYHQEMEIMNGQEMIQYDREPSEEYKKRAEEAIEGSSRMGNNPEWANVVAPGQGGDPTFGKKLVKAIKASEKKRSDGTPTSKMFGDDWEVVKDKSHKDYAFEGEENKKTIKESNKMKRLTFKKPFNGVDNALNLIPESYRVDNKVFEMTDGNESYRMRWEGSLTEGKAVVLLASDKRMVNEDLQKMKHLMGYKSEDTLGNLKGVERLSENKKFGDVWNKTKSLLTENMDECGTDMYEMEDQMTTNEGDVDKVMDFMNKNQQLISKLKTLNTPQEKIDFVDKLAATLAGGDDRIEAKMASAIKSDEPMVQDDTVAEAPVYEDRFEEVFAGLDEEDEFYGEEPMEEGTFLNWMTGANRIIKFLDTTELGQQIYNDFINGVKPIDLSAKYGRALITFTNSPEGRGAKFNDLEMKEILDYLPTHKQNKNK